MKQTKKICFVAIFLLLVSVNCIAQITETQAKNLAESNLCLSETGKPEYLRYTRDEDFEDEIFSLQVKDYKNPAKAAYVFRVKNTGTFITPSNEVLVIQSTGDDSKVVAVSKNTGKVFALDGCNDKERNFQDLITQAKIQINSVSEAESFGHLYYKLVHDCDLRRIIYNSRQFKHEVENYFFGKFNKSQAEVELKKWAKAFKKLDKDARLGLTAQKVKNSYSVSITFISGFINEVPKLEKITILVNESGIYQTLDPVILFPANKK